jgi:short-subunit dehydrogenase
MEGFYTLITGSSSGIGKALAIECAKRNMNLILTSRPSERLTGTVKEISSSYNVDVKYIAVDLKDFDAPKKIFDWCQSQDLRVNYLINNAGTTGTFPFAESDPDYLDSIIIINMRALTLLTRYFLPELKKYPGSKILNIGSMSGFLPIPYKGVYAASKAYVHSFSRSLEAELDGTGVKVYLVAPNGVDSNPLTSERINKHKLFGRLVKMSTESFAVHTLNQVEKGKSFYIPRLSNKLLFSISRILPDKIIAILLRGEFHKEIRSE